MFSITRERERERAHAPWNICVGGPWFRLKKRNKTEKKLNQSQRSIRKYDLKSFWRYFKLRCIRSGVSNTGVLSDPRYSCKQTKFDALITVYHSWSIVNLTLASWVYKIQQIVLKLWPAKPISLSIVARRYFFSSVSFRN